MHKALTCAADYGFEAVAMFLRNQTQWKAKGLGDDVVEQFLAARSVTGIKAVVAHGSYLVNLAGRAEVRDKSIPAMIEDVSRCERLGVEYLVFHPGSNPDQAAGVKLIAEALDEIIDSAAPANCRILLETTAGQGNCIGHRFEQLAEIMDRCKSREHLGVCLDTCHVFAAGYDLRSAEAYEQTMAELQHYIGFTNLCAIHLNDSKRPLAARVDRHEHIGRGEIGRKAFGHIAGDVRLKDLPMILETPKGTDERTGRDWDRINAEIMRRLAGGRRKARR